MIRQSNSSNIIISSSLFMHGARHARSRPLSMVSRRDNFVIKKPREMLIINRDVDHVQKKGILNSHIQVTSPLHPTRRNPNVFIVHDLRQVNIACSMLKGSDGVFLSFDTETTVTRKIRPEIPSVIQLATFKFCVIFQLFRMLQPLDSNTKLRLPTGLSDIFSSSKYVKVGVAATKDSKELESLFPQLKCNNILDLQPFCEALKIPVSIAKFSQRFALAAYRNKPTDKKATWKAHLKRNWDRNLEREEINYASKDVFAVLSCIRTLVREPHPELLIIGPPIDFVKILPRM